MAPPRPYAGKTDLMLTLRSSGFAELNETAADLIVQSNAAVERGMNFFAQSVAQRAKNLIRNAVPAGNVHFRENPARYVRASAPGQPPAIDLGNLIESIGFIKFSRTSNAAYAFAGAHYADDLEFGSDTFLPRPFFTPAYEAALVAAEKKFEAEWRKMQ